MDEFAVRFTEIREKTGLNKRSFADTIGISPSMVSDIENARREPSKEVLLRLSEKYGVNLHWMLTGYGRPSSREAKPDDHLSAALDARAAQKKAEEELQALRQSIENPPVQSREFSMVQFRRGVPMELDSDENDPNGVVLLPLFNQRSAAGPGQEVLETAEVETLVPVVREILGHRNPRDCGVVRVVGDSMAEIQLNNGDRAIFDRGDQDGDGVFVITHNGAVRIKRLQYRFDVKKVFIKSENRRYPDVEEEPIEAIGSVLRIEGKVIGWLHRHLY